MSEYIILDFSKVLFVPHGTGKWMSGWVDGWVGMGFTKKISDVHQYTYFCLLVFTFGYFCVSYSVSFGFGGFPPTSQRNPQKPNVGVLVNVSVIKCVHFTFSVCAIGSGSTPVSNKIN